MKCKSYCHKVANKLNVPLFLRVHISQRQAIMVTTLSFFIISIALLSLNDTPVNGFELSIYQKTPLVFWIAMIIGLINGGLLFFGYYKLNKKLWVIGLFEILLCNAIILSLNDLRGFIYLQRTDPLSYLGYSKDILLYGSIPEYNFYPLNSLLISFTSVITNLKLIESIQLFPVLFLTIYILSIFAWSKSISHERKFIAAMAFASFPILFAWFVPPIYYETLCVLMLPIFLYYLQKGESRNIRYIIITLILFLFFTFGHILVAIGLFLFMIIIYMIERWTKLERKTVTISLLLFSGLILFIWIATQAALANSAMIILKSMFSFGSNMTTFIDFENTSSKLGILNTLQSLLACTIDDIIFVLLSIWAAKIIFRNSWRTNPITKYLACFIGGAIFIMALIIMTFTHNPFRLINLNFIMVFTIPLVGFLVFHKLKHGKVTTVRFIILLILISIIASTFSIYQDPMQMSPNATITISEASGANWYINQRDHEINTSILQTSISRFADMIYGHVYTLYDASIIEKSTSSHFTTIMSSNETIENTYLIISEFDEEAYTNVWQDSNRFNDNDFQALSFSTMIDKNFDNGGFHCYLRE